MQLLKKLMANQKPRTIITLLMMCFIISGVIIFVGFELDHNYKNYITEYMEEQQLLTDQVSLRMQYLMENDQIKMTEVISLINGEVKTSGSRYWFIAQNERLVFVKNQDTTKLFTYITLQTFLNESQQEDLYITQSSFVYNNITYNIGLCTQEAYIVDMGKLFRHNIYIVMPIILLCAMILVLFILGILQINRQELKIKKLTSEAIDRNIMIENLTATMKKNRLDQLGGVRSKEQNEKGKVIYKKEVLVSLLDKINRENVVPLTILVIEITSKSSKYDQEEYHNHMKTISEYLNKEHVLAEILPGVYSVLLFHTPSSQREELKNTLVNQWVLPLKKKGFKVRLGISSVDDYDANVENVFETVYREVVGQMKLDDKIKKSS